MKSVLLIYFKFVTIACIFTSCVDTNNTLSQSEKQTIQREIQKGIDIGIEATKNKDIDAYMSRIPEDLVIYDESGEVIDRETQRGYAVRDWTIIERTLNIKMQIDSIQFIRKDSLILYNSQRWERIMFRRDGITTDTVVTTQRHREVWRKTIQGWFAYEVLELGGEVFINGEKYDPK